MLTSTPTQQRQLARDLVTGQARHTASCRRPGCSRPRSGHRCCLTMLRQIASPSPVPPFSRESLTSTWPNRSKMDSSLSAGMPRPSSRTRNSSSPADLRLQSRPCRRGGENLMAFESKLVRTCSSRSGSPHRCASRGATSINTPPVRPSIARRRRPGSSARPASHIARSMRKCPELTRSRSSVSLISRIRRSVFVTAISSMRWPFSGTGPRRHRPAGQARCEST